VTLGEAAALFGAGLAAGTINTIVGSGTLITFPTLLAFGYPPVVANVTNTVGLVPGAASGIHGYRAEIAEFRQRGPRLVRLVIASLLGGTTGALLLLVLPPGAFKAIVPVLILVALVLVVVQPRLSRRLQARRAAAGDSAAAGVAAAGAGAVGSGAADSVGVDSAAAVSGASSGVAAHRGGLLVAAAVFGSGMYGGYFGAAQGVLLLSILGITYTDRLQVLNGVKNVLAFVVNGIAAVIFIVAGALPGSGPDHPSVVWSAALAIAAGSVLGGQVGARLGRRLPPSALRGLIVVVGLVAVVNLLW
jgi:hypothetical protein